MSGFLGTPIVQYFNDDGSFLSGGKAYFYFPGTENLILVYPTIQDSIDQTNPLPNPVILDEFGRALIVPIGLYKIKLTDADDNEIWTIDNLGLIQGDVYDEFDNLILRYLDSGAGANYLTFQNNIKNNPAIVRADGLDTNIDLAIRAKGTGHVQIGSGLTDYIIPSTDGADGELVKTDGDGVLGFRLEGEDVSSYTHPAGLIDCWPTADSPPTGYLICDGSAISRATYATLFTAIGTTYGTGDGSTTFNLPNCVRRVIVSKGGTGTATLGNALGNTGGAEDVTLTTAQIPSHTHSYYQGYGAATNPPTDGSVPNATLTPFVLGSTATFNTGGGGSHNNIQPSIVLYYIIKT